MSNNSNVDGPVFIVGMPRSGTTLVSNLLNASNEVFIGTETHIFQIFNRWKSIQKLLFRKTSFVDFYFNKTVNGNEFLDFFSYDKDMLKVLYDKCKGLSGVADVLEVISTFDARGVIRWGEKTPGHFEYVEEIYNSFKEATVICVVRDPRDVYLSYIKVPWRITSPFSFCKRVKKMENIISKYKNNERFVVLRYEDILEDVEITIRELYIKLGLNFDIDVINYFNNNENKNFDLRKEPWKKNNLKGLKKDNIHKWKKDKSNRREINFISYCLKKFIDEYEYERLKNRGSWMLLFYVYFGLLSAVNTFSAKARRVIKAILFFNLQLLKSKANG